MNIPPTHCRQFTGACPAIAGQAGHELNSPCLPGCLRPSSPREMPAYVADLDLPGLFVTAQMDTSAASEARMPLKQYPLVSGTRWKPAVLYQAWGVSHSFTLASYLRFPDGYVGFCILPLTGSIIKIHEFLLNCRKFPVSYFLEDYFPRLGRSEEKGNIVSRSSHRVMGVLQESSASP